MIVVLSLWLPYRHNHGDHREDAARVDAEQAIAACQSGVEGIPDLACVIQYREAVYDKQHTAADLRAQQEMAEWAFLLLLVTTAGVIYVAMTLQATRDAVRVTREVGRDQSRAYVHVDKAELYLGNSSLERPRIILTIRNSGYTPTKQFSVAGVCVWYRETHEGGFDRARFESIPAMTWCEISAQGETTTPLAAENEIETIREAYHNRPTASIEIMGVIKYLTFFDEKFESEFNFFVRNPRSFRKQSVGGAEEKRSTEVPIKMMKPNGRDMRMYQRD